MDRHGIFYTLGDCAHGIDGPGQLAVEELCVDSGVTVIEELLGVAGIVIEGLGGLDDAIAGLLHDVL